MEIQQDGVDSEQIPEAFLCCICLDLLYKPVVLACGHMSCFWCVHMSMSGVQESHCPICRHPYYHFPTICWMLHFLLLKICPITYKGRECQILEEEKTNGFFSPVFDSRQCASHTDQELKYQDDDVNMLSRTFDSAGAINTVDMEGSKLSEIHHAGICRRVSMVDILCAACNQLLFQPVVLNCGHVFCKSCTISADEAVETVCQVCQRPDPRGFPRVCLVLDDFLVKLFPKEYAIRKEAVQLKQAQFQHGSPATCSAKADEHGVQFSSQRREKAIPRWGDKSSNIHVGVGCDFCGMCPIIGDRYRCVNCKEDIDFDLCGNCYNTPSKLPGRFNQQHTPEHRFEQVKLDLTQTMLSRLLRRQLQDSSLAFLHAGFAATGAESMISLSFSSDTDSTRETSNNLSTPASDITEHNQNDDAGDTI